MSENSKGNPPPKAPPPEKFQPKVLMIWMFILVAIVSLYYLSPRQSGMVLNLGVQDVVAAVEQGLVTEGAIKNDPSGGKDWYVLTGKMRSDSDIVRENLKSTRVQGEIPELVGFTAKGRVPDEEYRVLRGVFREQPANTFLSQLLISILPLLLIIGLLYFLFVRQLRNAGRGAMTFGKSRARMLSRDRDKVVFADVAGCDESKEEVSEIVDFLKDPKRFQKIGGKIPKGVLMVGPPGTGKTLLAKAVAGEADVPFFTISGSDFVEMFVGVGAARVRDMFEQARKNAPCIIFIDEIDAVGRQRGAGLGGGNDEREQTLNSLLVEMDGFDGHEGIIVIAATNRPDVLDKALLRPGRFDRQVVIDLPDLNGREEILKVHAKKVKLTDDIDLRSAARATPGFAGADLANLLNEAALIAARYRRQAVSNAEINEARDKIAYGRERKRLMDDEDKRITAWHESGHAIVQALIDDGYLPIHKVTIIPRGQSLGSTMFTPSKDILNQSLRRLRNQICCAMGGRVAEEITFDEITSGASGDIRMATKLARHMVCDWGMSPLGPVAFGENQDHVFLGKEITRNQNYSEETAREIDAEIRKIVQEQYERAKNLLLKHRKALDLLAEALLEHETVEGKHVKEILEYGEIRSEVINVARPAEPAEDEEKTGEAPDKAESAEGVLKAGGAEPAANPA